MVMGMEDNETFKVGDCYSTGEGRDYVWRFEVVARTAKFITVQDYNARKGETSRVGVKRGSDGHEYALPLGNYAMAPTINAARPLVRSVPLKFR